MDTSLHLKIQLDCQITDNIFYQPWFEIMYIIIPWCFFPDYFKDGGRILALKLLFKIWLVTIHNEKMWGFVES